MTQDRFLDKQSTDVVMKVLMQLAEETYVLQDRLAALESLLDKGGAINQADLDRPPSESELDSIKALRDEFLERVLSPIVESET